MAYHVAYLAKAYDIPPSLIVNNDQIGIHLVPTVGECTWESRGSKHIHVFWHKKQMAGDYGGIFICSKNIASVANHLYRHYSKDIATKQPKKSNVCSKWVGFNL